MKIKLLKSMGIDGKHTKAGEIIDADASFARYQISIGRAVAVDEKQAKNGKGVISTASGTVPIPENEPAPEPPKKPGK